MKTPRVLITGFDPFGGATINPSHELVRRLNGERIEGHALVGATLPVAFDEAPRVLTELIDTHAPVLVLAIGQAGGRSELSLERIAINLIDARIADHTGQQPIDIAIVAGAPAAYFATLPVKAMLEEIRAQGVPAALSLSAGSFVCNQIFYVTCHLLATRHPHIRCGFMHVPWLPEQAAAHPGQPSMALDTMLAGVRAAIRAAIGTTIDLQVAGGSTH